LGPAQGWDRGGHFDEYCARFRFGRKAAVHFLVLKAAINFFAIGVGRCHDHDRGIFLAGSRCTLGLTGGNAKGLRGMTAIATSTARELFFTPTRVAAGARRFQRIAFVASESDEACRARDRLEQCYGAVAPEQADIIVALGGDGLMLQTLHRHLNDRIPIYGMNRGTVGFLTNDYHETDLIARLQQAEVSIVHPLRMVAADITGSCHEALAINEVSLFRQTHQAAKLKISVDGTVRMQELVSDGALVATPAGSTAYNLSVRGPILPLGAPLLALTPISPFRPRRWPGAVLPNSARIRIEVLEPEKRPMTVVANHREFGSICEVTIGEMPEIDILLMFDRGHALGERLLTEQFSC
jgi:NAD+ kinase